MTMSPQHELPRYDHRAGAGPTLVFLHYWGGSARTWGPVVDRLTGRDVVTIDFRGWARSRALPGPYTLRQLAEDTLAVAADARVHDYVLVGHSMGGKVAQLVASTRPAGLRSIVLVGSGPAKPAAHVTASYRELLAHAYDSPASVTDARDHVLTATALPEQLKTQVVADSRAASTAALTEWPLRGIADDISARTRMIDVPSLVVAGEHDQVEPAAVLRDNLVPYLADVEMRVISGAGHLMPLETSGALADAIAEFVDAH